MHIAIVDDDPDIAALLMLWLEEEGHECVHYSSGQDFIRNVRSKNFDIILLDWIMPEFDGEQTLNWLNSHDDIDIPVIFVTQKTTEDDVAKILTLGADDYITKPVRHKEMIARINAVARRTNPNSDVAVIELSPYRIDSTSREVSIDGEQIKLTEKEFKLVQFLFKNVGRLLSRDHILSAVWGYDLGLNTRTVDTHMSRIRKKLDIDPDKGWRLSSIYHQGYRLEHLVHSSE
ncbi:MAG: response regulator transcription factor [Gammaproteobacteria bacterium]|nr:response regulator transcription factor [Gammaproteobacteria bacterium]